MGKKNGRRKSCGCGSVGECFCASEDLVSDPNTNTKR